MPEKGVIPKQGQIYAQALTYARQLDLAHLRQLLSTIRFEIIRKKSLRVSKKKKRE